MRNPIITFCLLLVPLSLAGKSVPLGKLNLPAGFSISVFAEVDNARQMTRSENGVIYVGSRRAGNVYAVIDEDGDYRADKVLTIDNKLNLPSGLAMKGKDLYVGAVNRILRYRDIDLHVASPPEPEVVIDSLPDKRHHGWKFIDFGPDGYLYIPVGAPCNLCLSDDKRFASILRTNLSFENPALEIFAQGIRNSVGFDWHPVTHELWFTDNGRDHMGDNIPPCELNHAPKAGLHFGYPFFHGNSIRDPEFGSNKNSNDYEQPALTLDPHVAPLGMMFYSGQQFPERFRNQILIPEHGSWNRSKAAGHTGYRITLAHQAENGSLSYETFIDGWLDNNKSWGRPVHILQLPDGSILVSDDSADVIYRVTYDG
ncbi:MAG: PQQ-dependent sugar dehydrogenase [Gammaproteobacteria bacterium]|nr:PQQ-dependent sugar dehydrogenase [Gammaproteobacteria bacterium]